MDYRNNKRYWIPLVGTLVGIVLIIGGFYLGNRAATKGFIITKTNPAVESTFKEIDDIDKYKDLFTVRDALIKNYVGKLDDKILLEGAIKGMTEAVKDPYTVYMNKDEYSEFNKQNSGEYTGIGIIIGVEDGKVKVISPVENSPAEKAGIKSGDIILKVNGETIGDDSSKAESLISGKKGEEVTLTLQRSGEKKSFDIKVKRDIIKSTSVEGEMINDNIGYIRVKSFASKDVTQEFTEKIESLKKDGMKKMILDLRGNPGGYLTEAIGVASQFIPKGKTITYTIDKYDNKDEDKSKGGIAEGMPLVVLIDKGSASASEVVTGALKDYGVATIVGENSFGKGVVQVPIEFENGSALKVTISKYYSPNGENIHGKGIKPDVEVEYPKNLLEKKYNRNTDPQLKKAIEVLKEKK